MNVGAIAKRRGGKVVGLNTPCFIDVLLSSQFSHWQYMKSCSLYWYWLLLCRRPSQLVTRQLFKNDLSLNRGLVNVFIWRQQFLMGRENYLDLILKEKSFSARWTVKPGRQNSPHTWLQLITELFFFFFLGLCWFPGSAWPDRNLHAWQDSNAENLAHSDLQSSLVAESSWECCHGLVSGTVWDQFLVCLHSCPQYFNLIAHWIYGDW